jgi:hypothetical protein
MPYGYHGKILHLDLTNNSFTVEKPEESSSNSEMPPPW